MATIEQALEILGDAAQIIPHPYAPESSIPPQFPQPGRVLRIFGLSLTESYVGYLSSEALIRFAESRGMTVIDLHASIPQEVRNPRYFQNRR